MRANSRENKQLPRKPTRHELETHLTPKELSITIPRSYQWILRAIKRKIIKVLPLGKPYLIPVDEARRLRGELKG